MEKKLDGVQRSTPKYGLCIFLYYRILEGLSVQGAVLSCSDGFNQHVYTYPILQMRTLRLIENKDHIQDDIDAG